MSLTEPKFSDLMEAGASLTDQMFYRFFEAAQPRFSYINRNKACAEGAACFAYAPERVLAEPLAVIGVYIELESKYQLKERVTLTRARYPELFRELLEADLIEDEEQETWELEVGDMIVILNDTIQYPVLKIAGIVRELGF